MDNQSKQSKIILYQTDEGKIKVNVFYADENFWLTQKVMGELFEVDRTVITKHLKNIFTENELSEEAVCAKFAHTAEDGKTYNTNSEETKTFYAFVQNKMHFAITGKTATEIIHGRADSEHQTMGLTTWKTSPRGKILKSDVKIAKNYLNENELDRLNRIVTMYIDYAEFQAPTKDNDNEGMARKHGRIFKIQPTRGLKGCREGKS